MEESVLDEIMDISKLKVPDLRKELKSRGLSTTGNKQELIDRLQSALKAKLDDMASAGSVDDLDEDLLNDDDLDHDNIDGTESVLRDLDAQLSATITPTKPLLTQNVLTQNTGNGQSESKAKKVVLKRNSATIGEEDEKSEKESVESKEKKILKLSELGVKERLELRAKKFGVSLTDEARKTARSERFGSNSTLTLMSEKNNPVTIDALKKRAERFGGSVSTVMSTLAQQERLEKRKQRFGVVTSVNGSGTQNEKAKLRLERFKTPIS